MQLHVLRGRELRQSARVSHHFIDKHVTGGYFWLFWLVRRALRVFLARCTATRIGREMPLVTFTALNGSTSLGFRIGVAMDHRTRWIFQGQWLTRVDHVGREALHRYLRCTVSHTDLTPRFIQHGVTASREFSVGERNSCLVIHKGPAFKVNLVIGRVMQLHVLRSRELRQSARVSHHFINEHIAGRRLFLLRFVWLVRRTLRVLLARCTATRISREMPLVAFTTLDRSASLGFWVGVAMDHRPRWIFQGQRLTRVDHIGWETLQRYLRCTVSHTDFTPRFIQYGITASREFSVGERDNCLVIHEGPAFEVNLVIGRVMQLHVLRGRELHQSAWVSHHFINQDITGGRLLLLGFVGLIRRTLRVLFARCTATRIGREIPLIALTALDGSASLGFRISVAMDHRAR